MIELIKKIINWFKSFFSKENKKSDKVLEEKYNKSKISKNNKKVLINIAPMDGSIGNKKLHKEYYEILPKDLIIFQKLERLRLDASDEEEEKINNLEKALISRKIDDDKKDKLNFELNNKEKIDLLSKDLIKYTKNGFTRDEEIGIKQAFYQYKNVNCVILETVLLDDIVDRINELKRSYNGKEKDEYYYYSEIRSLKADLKRIFKNYHSKNFQNEIYNLKDDLYTKDNDSYKLLKSDDFYDNINDRIDSIIPKSKKVDNEFDIKKIMEKKQEEEKKKEAEKKEKEEKVIKRKKLIEEKNKMIDEMIKKKRMMNQDLFFANKFINFDNDVHIDDDAYSKLMLFYVDYLNGLSMIHDEEIRSKTEMIRLYNSLLDVEYILTGFRYPRVSDLDRGNIALANMILSKKNSVEGLINNRTHSDPRTLSSSIAIGDKIGAIANQKVLMKKMDSKGVVTNGR